VCAVSFPRAVDIPPALAAVEEQLLAPGGMFETQIETVRGQELAVFKHRARSLREHVVNSAGFGDAEFLVFSDGVNERRFTFAEHRRLVASTAAVLASEYGVGPGDRVAIFAANTPEWIVTFWATVSLGAICVGLNGWWTAPEVEVTLPDARPKVLIGDAKRLARLDAAARERLGVPIIEMETEFDALWHGAPDAELPDQPIAEDDAAIILYTSGTTGRPKGAMHSHRNVNALLGTTFFHGARMMMAYPPPASAAPPTPNVQLVTYPLFHVSGLHTSVVSFLASGTKSVWTTGRFEPEVVMKLIERERVTGWSFTPTMLHRVISNPAIDTYDLTSIRSGGGGGAPFSPTLLRSARERIPGLDATLGVGYGLTEFTALASLNSGEELRAHPLSAGRPLPTVEIEIHDDDGQPTPNGVDGEIWLRGPLLMLGYWNNPEANAETITPEGWLRTGDIGAIEGGRLALASRKRDMILRGGENVYPVEIEYRLEEHPDVDEAAVVGIDDEDLGQKVRAVVVPAPGRSIDVEELSAFCAAALAYFKVPEVWDVRTEPLPRNATGKVMKHVLEVGDESGFVDEG
jgi:long-chain acyl-CoA synthetase